MTRDIVIVAAGRIVQMAVLLATLRVMTQILPAAQVGTFSILVSVATFFVWLLISPVGLYVNRRTIDWTASGSARRNYAIHFAYVLLVAIGASAALFLLQLMLDPQWGLPTGLTAGAIGVYIFFSVASNTLTPALNILNLRISYTLLYTFTQILCLAASYGYSTANPLGMAWFQGQIAGFAVGAALSLPFFLRATPANTPVPVLDADKIRAASVTALAFVLPVVLAWSLTWVQFQSYRILVGELVSLDFLGRFFAGYALSAGIMGAIEIAGAQFFYPYFYRGLQGAEDEKRFEGWRVYIGLLMPMILIIAAAMIATQGPAASLFLAASFRDAAPFIAIGAVVEGVRVLAGGYALAAHASMQTRALLLPHAVGAASMVTSLVVFIFLFGENGVPAAMIVSSFVFLGVMHARMTAHSGTRIPFFNPMGTILALVALAGLWLGRSLLPEGLFFDLGLLACAGVIAAGALTLLFLSAKNALADISR